jgi:organic radical activating enzyme
MKYIRPRIRLTNYCNRRCPYCFADDFLSGKTNENHIKLEEIKLILDMCKESNIDNVAWQGGEPMIHTQIIDIIEMHKKANMSVNIFTNGMFSSEVVPYLKDLDFYMLINLNSPDTYNSEEEYNQILNNIDEMKKLGLGNRISLGYNFYGDNPDYGFFIDVLKKFKIRSVRIDMVRPSISDKNTHYQFKNISNVFPKLRQMMDKCVETGAYFSHFDCPFPLCELNDEDLIYAWRHFPKPESLGRCYTHIDIQSGLRISSCFCSYEFKDITINDFESLSECRSFIKYFEDKLKWNTNVKEECNECSLKNASICQGGCLGYNRKQEKIVINREDLVNFKEQNINLNNSQNIFERLDMFEEFMKVSNDIQEAKENFIEFIENSAFPSYELFTNFKQISINNLIDTKEMHEILTKVKSLNHPLRKINEYYLTLCEAEILYIDKQFEESKKYYKEAYKNVNYLDIRHIVERLIDISSKTSKDKVC